MGQYKFPDLGMGTAGIEPASSGLQPDAKTNSATFPIDSEKGENGGT
jgi:hypothetical protein